MASLDETNIFGIPPKQPEKKNDSLSRLGIDKNTYLDRIAQRQKSIEIAKGVKEKSEMRHGLGYPQSQRAIERSDLIKQYTTDLGEAIADPTQEKRDTALESFFETPFSFQMAQYLPDITGLPTDIVEAEYAGRKLRESREARGKGIEFYPGPLGMGDRPYYPDMTPEEAGLKLQQGFAIGSIPPGIGGIAGIAQSIIGLPAKAMRAAKTMDGQGIAGIGHNQGPPLDTAPKYLSPRSQAEYNKLESRAFEKSQREDKPMSKIFTDETKKDQFFARKSNVTDDEFEVFAEWIESSKDQNIKNQVADVIKANKEKSLGFGMRGFESGFGRIDDISQKHLFQNNLVDADGNVTLYRAINLGENQSLVPDTGLVSTTIDPKYVTNLAKQESEKVAYVIPENMKSKVDIFDTPLDLAMKGIEREKQVMKRTPMIVQYKVPVNKVEAYLPAILNKMDDFEMNSVASKRAYRDYGDEIAKREDAHRAEGYEDVYGIDDEVIHEYGIKEDILDTLYNADLESEVILNATDLKPSGVFTLEDFTKQMNK